MVQRVAAESREKYRSLACTCKSDEHNVKPDISQFTEADYDFTNVPPTELESCLYYEYMRESEAIIQQVENLRLQLSKEAKRQGVKLNNSVESWRNLNLVGWNFTVKKVTTSRVMNIEINTLLKLARIREFPNISWQKLSSSIKETLRHFPGKERHWLKTYPPLVIETLANDPSLGDFTLISWLAKQRQQYKEAPLPEAEIFCALTLPKNYFETGAPLTKFFASGFFRINLNYSQPKLRKAFNDWLKENHPKIGKQPRGRRSPSDQLNALGAMRLRFHCSTLPEAQKLIAPLAGKARKMRYRRRDNFNRACESALHHFRTLLELSEAHLPIHYTKGWQGGRQNRNVISAPTPK